MNILQKLQEQYVNEFNANIPLDEFLLNIIVVAILVSLLRIFYIRYGNSHTNRKRFAANFLPLALATLLVIMIVKSSIALFLLRTARTRQGPPSARPVSISNIGSPNGVRTPSLAALMYQSIKVHSPIFRHRTTERKRDRRFRRSLIF